MSTCLFDLSPSGVNLNKDDLQTVGRELLVAVALFNLISPDKALTAKAKQIWNSLLKSSGSREKQLIKDATALCDILRDNDENNSPTSKSPSLRKSQNESKPTTPNVSSTTPKSGSDRFSLRKKSSLASQLEAAELWAEQCSTRLRRVSDDDNVPLNNIITKHNKTHTGINDVSINGTTGINDVSINGVGYQGPLPVEAVCAEGPCRGLTHNNNNCVRIYADGVFDLIHSGHFNALRQAKLLGDRLVVGINSDAEVEMSKGVSPIYTQQERTELVRGCKWVDEVVEGTPYSVSSAFLKEMKCDFVAHGDDLTQDANGQDTYSEPAAEGKLKVFRRTLGISSTTLVWRLLWATADITPSSSNSPMSSIECPKSIRQWLEEERVTGGGRGETPAQRLMQFIGDRKQPKPADRIVYVDGSFDVFHVGHLRILQKAKKLGDYLVVGVHDDETVARVKGRGFPVMSVLERALNVLAMRVVDEVILGAPWVVTDKFIRGFGIDTIVCGRQIDATVIQNQQKLKKIVLEANGTSPICSSELDVTPTTVVEDLEPPMIGCSPLQDVEFCYDVAKKMDIFVELNSESTITTKEIIERIVRKRQSLLSTISSRSRKEGNVHVNTRKLG